MAISKFADLLGGLDAIENRSELDREPQMDRLSKSDIESILDMRRMQTCHASAFCHEESWLGNTCSTILTAQPNCRKTHQSRTWTRVLIPFVQFYLSSKQTDRVINKYQLTFTFPTYKGTPPALTRQMLSPIRTRVPPATSFPLVNPENNPPVILSNVRMIIPLIQQLYQSS